MVSFICKTGLHVDPDQSLVDTQLLVTVVTLADLGFLEGCGDFGNPNERSERALRGSGLTAE